MKVAFITHYTELYGANRSLLNLVDGLKKYGIEPYIIAPTKGDITNVLEEQNIQVAKIPLALWVHHYKLEGNFADKLRQIKQHYYKIFLRLYKNIYFSSFIANQLSTWNVDVIYTNSAVTPVGAIVAKRLNLPHVWHLREFIDLDYDYHHDWGKAIFNYVVNQADAKIAISNSIHKYYLRSLSLKQFHIIYNGIASIKEFDRIHKLVSSVAVSKDVYTFAIVGRIYPKKGQETAIRAIALLVQSFSRVRLLVVGEGKTSHLKKIAHDLGIADKVEFWGHLDDPYQAYFASDAVLMCSHSEGMGRVTVEAMSACRPVIGYDNAGTSEIIQHEYSGLLYQDGCEALAASMKRFVENPTWARQLGENAWRVARSEYSTETYAQKVSQVLFSITKIPKLSSN